jgi:putative NIF3 family GTP cyclohydrolase 1 type 2
MAKLATIKEKIDTTFQVKEIGLDPQMAMFIPRVYDPIDFDWKHYFDDDFVDNLNGLMLRGSEEVRKVYLASFPQPDILDKFIAEAQDGDLFFAHHPIVMLCGDPRGKKFSAGWVPLSRKHLDALKERKLSFYGLHGPLDYKRDLGTRSSMMKTLNAVFEKDFHFDGKGYHGAICSISPVSCDELVEKLKQIYGLPYVDLAGRRKDRIERVAIVAGGADNLQAMHEAEKEGLDAYIAGEIFSRLNTEWGDENNPRMIEFNKNTNMTMIGVSHAGSEYLTMKFEMEEWFKNNFSVETELLPQKTWWI